MFRDNDIEDVIEMFQQRVADFKQTQTLKPFYLKSINTLRVIIKNELQLPHLYYQYLFQYPEVISMFYILQITYENTSKLLLRCEIYLRARQSMVRAFLYINKRMAQMRLMKNKIAELEYEIEDTEEEDELKELGQTIVMLSRKALEYIVLFRRTTPIFDRAFVFKGNVSIPVFIINRIMSCSLEGSALKCVTVSLPMALT